eukprot:gnl/TRDRNA2_/TRDRNA2_172319_c1_seq2.p1 gnl/TRDRNA2_/TRDRNA2_172319_c1~~gnl/TRDRNA2_/TRDRNA2_172319_c1_seq2.p1  ORF type:complete len:525 (+),score=139.31 gnl/TRDRNA2_/TRDRNA2_172319_c1_seq2:81-1577(+)
MSGKATGKRSSSPPNRKKDTDDSAVAEKKPAFVAPPRPEGCRKSVLNFYGVLAASVLLFVFTAQLMKNPVEEGKFRKKDGTLMSIDDFDPVVLGPYPKCHKHNGEYEQVNNSTGKKEWVKIADAPSKGPFPVGHPENPEWKAKAEKDAAEDARATMFQWKGLQPSLHLLALAVVCVHVGSQHGVYLFTVKPDSEEGKGESQILQSEDAYWFPVMGSIFLFGLFIVYKYIGSDWIKFLVSCYVVFMCCFAFGANAGQFVDLVKEKTGKVLFKVPYFDLEVKPFDLVGVAIGAVMSVGYLMTKNWIINNVFGLSFCLMGLKTIGTSSFKTGAIMLIGLFFYDIFWVFGSTPVFGSNVMVTVAKGVEAPIKLMFPRNLDGCGNLQFSMLGLGDIVVPGIYIAFLAKWDAVLIGQKKAKSMVYLNVTMVSYALALVTTVGVMLIFNAAQPALLYIVPYVLLTSVALALVRGEFKDLWNWEIPSEDEKEKEGGKDKAEEKKDK